MNAHPPIAAQHAPAAVAGIRTPPGWTVTELPANPDAGVPFQTEIVWFSGDETTFVWLVAVQDGKVNVYYQGGDKPISANSVSMWRTGFPEIADTLDRADAALARWLAETHTGGDL